MQAFDRMNKSLIKVFGKAATIDGSSVQGVLTRPVVDQHAGPGDARRPAPELHVITADISGIDASPRKTVTVDGNNFLIVANEPNYGGMTKLILRSTT